MYSPHLDKKHDFNDPAQRQAFEESYRSTVGENSRSPLAQDFRGNWYFNGATDQANRNKFDAQNDPEASYKAMAKKSAIAQDAYNQTTADIKAVTTTGYDWVKKLFGDSIDEIADV